MEKSAESMDSIVEIAIMQQCENIESEDQSRKMTPLKSMHEDISMFILSVGK